MISFSHKTLPDVQQNHSIINIFRFIWQPRVQFIAILLICSYYCAIRTSVVLDDAFIYFRVVGNILRIGEPVFNPGDNYFIVTSPLWTALLTAGKYLFSAIELEVLAKLLWLILLMFASYFTYETFLPILNRWAMLIPCFFFSPAIGSMMGNEIALLYAAMFGVIWSLVKNRPILTGMFIGTGYLARGEFILFLIPVIVYFIITHTDRANWVRATFRFCIPVISTAAPIILLWHLYYWFAFHHIFPNTLHIKMIQGASGYWPLFYQKIWGAIAWILNDHFYLLVFAIIGAIRQYKIFGLIVLYTLLHSILYIRWKIPFYHWYYYDYFILILLLIFIGVVSIVQFCLSYFERKKFVSGILHRIYRVTSCLILIVGIIWFFQIRFQYFLPKYISNIYFNNGLDERYNTYRELSTRLRAEIHQGDVILAEEVGICSYYLQNIEVRDMAGIASPDITAANINNWSYFIDTYKPRYLIFIKQLSMELQTYEYNGHRYTYQLRLIGNPRAEYFAGTVYEMLD